MVWAGRIFHQCEPLGIMSSCLEDTRSCNQSIHPKGKDRLEVYRLTRLLPNSVGLAANHAILLAESVDVEHIDAMVATEDFRN